MSRVLPLVLTIVLLLMAVPASAIPICPSTTMADYIAFGSTGCNIKNLTFLNFSYSATFRNDGSFVGNLPPLEGLPAPPSAISVQPRSNPSLGSGGAALSFSPSPHSEFYWGFVNVGFEVFARTGPGIVRNDLSADLHSLANFQSADITELAKPGGGLFIAQGSICFRPSPASPDPFFSFCANPTNLSVPFTRFQEIDISGRNVDAFEAGFATPEPATLLLVGTGAAGLGLARWLKRRRAARC
jgi:hypothetical protein